MLSLSLPIRSTLIGVARIAFQHDVDVYVLGIDASEGIEDTALAGNQRGARP